MEQRSSDGASPTRRASKSPGQFLHHKPVLLVWLLGFFVVSAVGGKVLLGIVASGLVMTYLFDLLGLREATFLALWLTCFASTIQVLVLGSVFVNYSVWHLGLLVVMMLFCALSGCWASLHFRWLAELSPVLPPFLERVLVSALPVVSATLTVWALGVVGSDLSYIGYQLFAVYALFYYLLGLPLPPSYRRSPDRVAVQSRLEAAVAALVLVLLPVAVHLAIFAARAADSLLVVHDAVLLLSMPVLYLRLLDAAGHRPCWWSAAWSALLARLVWPALLLSVYSFQERVVFRSFGFLVSSHLQAPWDWLLVTATLYALLALAHLLSRRQHLSPPVRYALAAAAAGVCLAVALIMGAPLYILLVAAATGAAAVLFFLAPRLATLLLATVGASLWCLWFLATRVALVSYDFASFTLASVVYMLTALLVVGLFSAGLLLLVATQRGQPTSASLTSSSASSGATPTTSLLGVLLVAYAGGVLVAENTLFSDVNYPMYPSYLVVVTSLVGFFLASRLSSGHLGLVPPVVAWLLCGVAAAKLSLFLSTQIIAHAAFGLQFLASSALAFFPQLGKQPNAPYLLCFLVGGAALFVDVAAHEAFSWALTEQHSTLSFFVTAFLLLWGLALLPLLVHLPPGARALPFVRRFVAILLSCGAFAVFLNIVAGALLFEQLSSTLWLLFPGALCIAVGCGQLSSLVAPAATLRRALLNVAAGAVIGQVFCSAFLPATSAVVYACVAALLGLGIAVVSFMLVPVPDSKRVVPFLFLAWLVLFPLAMLVVSLIYEDLVGPYRVDNLPVVQTLLIALVASVCFAVALIAKIDLTNAAVGVAAPSSSSSAVSQREAALRGAAALSSEWKAGVGNLALVVTFALSVVLNIYYLAGSESCIYLLSPLLLLLNRHWFLLDSLSDRNRFFPLAFGVFLLLTLRSAVHLLFDPTLPWSLVVVNVPLLVLTVPTQLLFVGFLASSRPSASRQWILAAPLNLIALFFTDLLTIQGLAATGLLYSIVYSYLARQIRTRGQQIL